MSDLTLPERRAAVRGLREARAALTTPPAPSSDTTIVDRSRVVAAGRHGLSLARQPLEETQP